MKQLNFNNQKTILTQNDIDQLVAIICHRCRINTYNKVRARLTYFPNSIPDYGILNRLVKEGSIGSWSYYAGQSYPDEIRTVRNIILNDYGTIK